MAVLAILFLILDGFVGRLHAAPALVINEIIASNLSYAPDENGDCYDWIELYNTGDDQFDLTGCGITDDDDELFKWVFPEFVMPPHSFLLVYASDKDGIGSGVQLERIINIGDTWRYRVWTSPPPEDWTATDYDDSDWDKGPSGFGYGDDDDATDISGTPVSVFVRKSFTLVDLKGIENAVLEVDFDDGFIAYLNGAEIRRINVPSEAGPLTWDARPSTHVEAHLYKGQPLLSHELDEQFSLFREGENVLAVQIHNAEDSDDMSLIPVFSLSRNVPSYHTNFKLSEGEAVSITAPDGSILDRVVISTSLPDISYGRYPDGGGSWYYFTEPTPASANQQGGLDGEADAPEFSAESGFYSGFVKLDATTTTPSAFVTYTVDGSEPTSDSPHFDTPLTLNRTTVVKARAFGDRLIPSPVVTSTYFVNETTTLAVISLSTNPTNLWDESTGIYTGSNYKKDIEHPAYIEFFEEDGSLGFSSPAGMKIHGASSASFLQKSLALYARREYGAGSFDYRLFPEKDIEHFESFILRNSGHDWGYSMMRDALGSVLARGTVIDYQAYRPTVLFINGQYWGLHNIREKINEHYLASNHEVDPDYIDIMEYVVNYGLAYGDRVLFDEMISYIETHDLGIEEYYRHVENLIDIEEFIDYQALEIYFDNGDWPGNNVKLWRSKNPGGKWRWILYDLDVGFGHPDFPSSPDHNKLELATHPDKDGWGNYGPWSTFILRNLLKNEEFRIRFITRFADLLNTSYDADNVNGIIDELADVIRPEMTRHFTRWGGSVRTWENRIAEMRSFATARVYHQRIHIKDYFGLNDYVQTRIFIEPPDAGSILLNSIVIDAVSWNGYYFGGLPITLKAVAAGGYRFLRWEGDIESETSSVGIAPQKEVSITAVFGESPLEAGMVVINEINYNSSDDFDPGDWVELCNPGIEAVDISGWTLKDDNDEGGYVFGEGTLIGPDGYLVVCTDRDRFLSLFPDSGDTAGDMLFGLSGSGDMVRLYDSEGAPVDSLLYDDKAPWPVEPDGSGATLALLNSRLENSDPANWEASEGHGTPGAENSATTTSVHDRADAGHSFLMGTNHPNPFNPSTKIIFSLPESGHATLTIYNLAGQKVRTLADEPMAAGNHNMFWNGRDDAGQRVSAGVYLACLKAGSAVATRKMMLMK